MISSLVGIPLECCSGLSKSSPKLGFRSTNTYTQTLNTLQPVETTTICHDKSRVTNQTLNTLQPVETTTICHHKSRVTNFLQHKSLLPIATSLALLLYSSPANAGFLSGSTGIESIPGPELPKFDSLDRFNEENQKRYAENDARFKESPILKQLLEKSKLNKEKNKRETEDKYCLRGAEWGVGDCSTAGMSEQKREEFIAMLKKKAGVE